MKKILLLIFASCLFWGCMEEISFEEENGKPEEDEELIPDETWALSGKVQKGPFLDGGTVTVHLLDENLSQTGESYTTEISGDDGSYSFEKPVGSRYVEVAAIGYFFNENTGSNSSSTLTLKTVADLSSGNAVNLNVLTSISAGRIENLVSDGADFEDARRQAEQEALSVFYIEDYECKSFNSMDIAGNDVSDAILLAASVTVLADRQDSDVSALLSDIASDLASDGKAGENATSALLEGSKSLDPEAARENLAAYYSRNGFDAVIPDFEDWLDVNANGVPDKDDSWLILDEKDFHVSDEGGEFSVGLQHNVEYEISVEDDASSWISVSPDTKGYLEPAVLTFTVAANVEYDERFGRIAVKDAGSSHTEYITVSQKHKDAITVTSDVFEVPAEGGTVDIEVKSNVTYSYSIPEDVSDWIRAVPQTKGLESSHVILEVDRSYEAGSRSAEIVFTDGSIEETVTIWQTGEKVLLLDENEFVLPDSGGYAEIYISSNCSDLGWRINGNADWITEVRTRGYDITRLLLSISPNTTYSPREAEVEIYDKSGDLSETVSIYQVQNNALILAKDRYDFENEGGNFSVEVQHNVPVEVEIPDTTVWISRVETRTLGTSVMNFSVEANDGYDNRSGVIIFHSRDKTLSDTVTVWQTQKNAIILGQKEYEVSNSSGMFSVDVRYNVDYTVSVSDSWLHYQSTVQTKGLVSGTLMFSYGQNKDIVERTATAEIRNEETGISETLTVRQKGRPYLSVEEKTYSVPYTGGRVEIPVTSNTDYEVELSPSGVSSWITLADEAGETDDGTTALILDVAENTGPYNRSGKIIISGGNAGAYTVTVSQERNKTESCLELVYNVTSTTDYTQLFDQLQYGRVLNPTVANGLEISRVVYDDEEVVTKEFGYQYKFKRTGSVPVKVYYYGELVSLAGFTREYMTKPPVPLESAVIPATCSSLGRMENMESLKELTILNPDDFRVSMENCPNFTAVYGPMASDDNRAIVTPDGRLVCYAYGGKTHCVIPQGVREIAPRIFKGYDNLMTLYLPESLEKIGAEAFSETQLTSVTLPQGLKSIGGMAFFECTRLKEIVIPDGCTDIGASAFSGCTQLQTVVLPEGLTEILIRTFFECESLTSVTIPSTVRTIGEQAFYRCTSLPSIIIPEGVETIDNSFATCSALKSVTFPSTLKTVSGFGGTALESVTIPAGVTNIGGAFNGCSSLKYVVFEPGSQLQSIGRATFHSTAIESITIPANVQTINNGAFEYCNSLKEVKFEAGSRLTAIGDGYKSGNSYYGAFHGCPSLVTVELPEGLRSIGIGAFTLCEAITDMDIPSTVTSIGAGAFFKCSSLTEIKIPDAVTAIGADAFYYCNALAEVRIGSGLVSISPSAFFMCNGLSNIMSSSPYVEVTSDNRCLVDNGGRLLAFAWNGVTGSYEIPSSTASFSIRFIAPEVFKNCSGISTFTIPETVEGIGKLAFYNTSIETVYCKAVTPPVLDWSDNVTESSIGGWIVGTSHLPFGSVQMYVPSSSLEDYQGDSKWSRLNNIVGYSF